MPQKYFKGVLALAALLVLFLLLRGCKKPQSVIDTPLKSEDVLHVGLEHGIISVQTDKETTSKYVPSDGRVDVTVDKKGVVTLDVKDKGLSFRPVIGPFISNRLSLAAGAQLAYWNRTELYGGVKYPVLAAFAAAGYRLDQLHLSNTSIYVAYTTSKELGAGLFLRF